MDNQIDAWKWIDGLERRETALSDHLLSKMEHISPSFLPLTPDIAETFQLFEMLCSLAFLERYSPNELDKLLAADGNGQDSVFMPVGRAAWNEQTRSKLLKEMRNSPLTKSLTDAGFGRGAVGFLRLYERNLERIAKHFRFR
jgi:hypothetical protein